MPVATSAKLENAVKRIEAQFAVHWECCNVLIDLADGTEDDTPESTAARRERCVSMMPISGSPAKVSRPFADDHEDPSASVENILSPQMRQMELLQGMLGDQSRLYRASESSLKQQTASPQLVVQPPVPTAKPRPVQRTSIFGIRDFLKALRKENAGNKASSLAAPILHAQDERRSVSDPLRSSTNSSPIKVAAVLDSSDGEEEEDWDQSSSGSSDDTSRTPSSKLNMPRSRTMSVTTTVAGSNAPPFPLNSKLKLSSEAMPSLIAYLGEVKEKCMACLTELRGITV